MITVHEIPKQNINGALLEKKELLEKKLESNLKDPNRDPDNVKSIMHDIGLIEFKLSVWGS